MYCGPCYHRNRQRIDQQIIERVPYRTILKENPDLSLGAISRHKAHIREALAEAMALRTVEGSERGSALLDRVESLLDEAKGILSTAKTEKDLTAAVAAVNACTRLLELCGRLDGSLVQPNAPGLHLTLSKTTTVNVHNYGDDTELALLIQEATKDFDLNEMQRLKALAESANSAITQP